VHDRFEDIRGFYSLLDANLQEISATARARGNACGTCFECCKYNFYLSKYEFDYLEDHLIRTRGESHVEWVTCSTPIQDKRRSQPYDPSYRCPLYEEGVGCTVYEARPLACRTLGPMLPHHSKLPSWCVYTNPISYDRTDAIPLWSEYADMLRRHQPAPAGYFVARPAKS
jgi:Fe-S-cluster containining protein